MSQDALRHVPDDRTNTQQAPVHRCASVCVCVWLCVYIPKCTFIHGHIYTNIHINMYIYVYTCMYLHLHALIHICNGSYSPAFFRKVSDFPPIASSRKKSFEIDFILYV